MNTTTQTHTITHARYLSAKVSADLKRIQRLVGRGIPTDDTINDYEQEAIVLLHYGCLGTVTYGFRSGDRWTFAVQYKAENGELVSDNDPGKIPYNLAANAGGDFSSFLEYSAKWGNLSAEEKKEIEKQLPFKRSIGDEPKGQWDSYDHFYQSGNMGLRRRTSR